MGRKKKSGKSSQQANQEQEQKVQEKEKQLSPNKESIGTQDEAAEKPQKNDTKKKNHQSARKASHNLMKRGESLIEQYPHYTWEQVAKHDNKDHVWVVIQDNVYDVTKLVGNHPGGPKVILHRAGKEASKQFQKGHHPYHVLEDKLPKLLVGRIKSDSSMESWQREKKTGKMDLFCVSVLSLILFSSLMYLITT